MSDWIDLTALLPSLSGQTVHVRPRTAVAADGRILRGAGFRVYQIEGSAIDDASSFLAEAGRALELPEYYGGNWDALVDCLSDFAEGADRRVAILWSDAGHLESRDPQAFVDALVTLDRAAFDATASDEPKQIELFLYGAGETVAIEVAGQEARLVADQPVVLVYADDLMFTSKIREAAGAAPVHIRVARNPEGLDEAVGAVKPVLVLADLDARHLEAASRLGALKSHLTGARLIGFFSHVDTERAAEAKAAGFDRVLARSAFVQELPRLLETAAGRGAGDHPRTDQ